MKHSFLDRFSELDSPIHRLDPRVKIVALLAAILIVVSEPRGEVGAFWLYYMLAAILLAVSRIPLSFVMKRCLMVTPFILMAAGLMLLTGSGNSYDVAASIALKAFAAVILLTILTSTERFHRLLGGMRALKMPELLGTLSAFMYRYAFILSDEVMRTTRARQSRTPGRLKTGRFRAYGNQAATIFLRSWERSETVYNAMCSRGFTGRFPLANGFRFRIGDGLFLVLSITLFLAARILV